MNSRIDTTQEVALALRVNNALLLAQAMNLDMTKPLEAAKVLRHLATVEKYVGNDADA